MRWNSDESVVTYNRDIYYVFVPEKSVGDPQDHTITVLNVPLIVSNNRKGLNYCYVEIFHRLS